MRKNMQSQTMINSRYFMRFGPKKTHLNIINPITANTASLSKVKILHL